MEILSIGKSLIDLFFPYRCLNCDMVITDTHPLCVRCSVDLPYTHWKMNKENHAYRKLKPLCRIEWAYSLLFFRHDNITQKLLHYLKYHGHLKIGELLAEKVAESLNLSEYDGIIPIPVHPKKLKKRGYNQVMPFAKRLAEISGVKLVNDFLIRIENNPSQVFNNREKRLNSIKNAFGLRHNSLEGKFILIDDVLTTGATISTCVNLIRSETSASVSVITIACAD